MQVPQDLLRLVYGMLALIPLCALIRFLPSYNLRFYYSLVLGFILQLLVFQDYMYPIYVQHIIVYLIIKKKGPKCGGIVTLESMIFLSGYQIYELIYNYGGWTMNASALLMILVCKYSLLGYNLEDGSLPEEKVSKQQQKYRIKETVSFLDFLGYLNFLPTSLVGPPLQYNDYKQFILKKGEYQSNNYSVLKILGVTFAQTIFFAVIYVIYQIYAPVTYMRQQQFYESSFLFVIFYAVTSVTLVRFKYYFGWKLIMCAVHASGVSYNGQNFLKINTVNPWIVETTIHAREKINYWNISVQQWLRKCIYQRSPFKNKTLSQLYVFVVSAFWHGFYGSYYISFVLWFIQLHLQALIFKYSQSQSTILAKTYKSLGKSGKYILFFLVTILFNTNAAYFQILKGKSCIQFLMKTKFLPQIIMIVLTVVFTFVKAPKQKKQNLGVSQKKQ